MSMFIGATKLPEYVNWILIGIGSSVGLFVARVCYALDKAGFFCIGGLGGFLIATMLY